MVRNLLSYLRSSARIFECRNVGSRKTLRLFNVVKLRQVHLQRLSCRALIPRLALHVCSIENSTSIRRQREVSNRNNPIMAESTLASVESVISGKDCNATAALSLEPVSDHRDISPSSESDQQHDKAGSINRSIDTNVTAMDEAKTQDSRMHLKRKEFSGKTKKGKRLDKHPKKIQKFSNDQKFNETTYYFEKGMRKVIPYVYVFETHIKGRWMGRSVLDVFRGEFRMETPEYYKKAISAGLITINRQKVSADKILHNNEFLRSMVHRHEPPVAGEPLDIIAIDDEFVVINKPASIPVHPCGKYRHNTIIFMLGKEHGLTGLHTIHRLDRLTSGLLMFARTREVSQRVDAYVRDRKLTKVYVCKVDGQFPSEPVDCLEPILTVSHKIGVCKVSPEGKQCKTAFKRLSYDGRTSIVQCTPHTGRMHQIRVHLQYLGYPIVNDPLYNNPVWGPQLGKGGLMPHSEEDLLTKLIKQHTAEITSQVIDDPDDFVKITRHQLVKDTNTQNDTEPHSDEQGMRNESTNDPAETQVHERGDKPEVKSNEVKSGTPCDQVGSSNQTSESPPLPSGSELGSERLLESEEELMEPELHRLVQSLCRECKLKLRDPTPEEMTMYLHALSYKGPDFEFSTPLPRWAEEHIQRSAAVEPSSD